MTTATTLEGLDGLTVSIEDDGTDKQPWTPNATVYRYRVTIEDTDGNRYEASAWGSINDYEQMRRDNENIGWMVVDELLNAAYDPDEFFTMATEGEGGRQRAQQILDLIATAEKMLPALERNEDAISDHR